MSAAGTSHRDPPKVPNHELIRVIGRGAYGEIWMARSELGVLRAVKVVDRRTFDTETAFQREFDGMARFEPISREHSAFVDILHVGRDGAGEFFYYVMELADDHLHGQEIEATHYIPKTLRTELARRSRLLADEVITLGLTLSEGLADLHREGLVHRDIKLANVIFVAGRPKIADIGLVAASGQNSYVGTEGYVPPEGPGTPQGDIFSLGKVLYELAMGKDRMDFPALITRLDDLPDRDVLLRLNEVFLRACANEPSERYSRAEQMHEDLERIRAGRPLARLGRRKLPFVVAALVLVAGLASGGYYIRTRDARGAVTIDSDPPGARVFIADRWVATPATVDRLPAGSQRARVMLPDYDPVEIPVEIEADSVVTLPKVVLKRSSGALTISTKQPNATFELRQGEMVAWRGILPVQIPDLPTGKYTLVAALEGREKTIENVEIARNETTPVEVEFLSGRVTVTSQPAGAEISVDGQPCGKTPIELSLPDGPHELVAKYGTWPEQHEKLAVDPAQPMTRRFEFVPGSVKITSAPGGATVRANDRDLGMTPLLLENLEPGPVRYTLLQTGFEPMEISGEVNPGRQTFLGATFRKRIGPQRNQPWENSLGMKFVPVGEVLMSVWLTRVKDYDAFCAATNHQRQKPDFPQDPNHPVVLVNYEDATAFCEWLTRKEQEAEKLTDGQLYRLPRDVEWSQSAGLPDEGRTTPEERDGKIREFSWGKHWPPPAGSGNFADSTARRGTQGTIGGYHDGYAQTSPVGSFAANAHGLFDVSGNVWQWILEPYNPTSRWGVLRGGSWATHKDAELSLSYRNVVDPSGREVIYGFRVLLVPESTL
jgi:hypothetical protein